MMDQQMIDGKWMIDDINDDDRQMTDDDKQMVHRYCDKTRVMFTIIHDNILVTGHAAVDSVYNFLYSVVQSVFPSSSAHTAAGHVSLPVIQAFLSR